ARRRDVPPRRRSPSMITLAEAVRGVYGAWRLVRFDRDAVRLFDGSVDAFWKSFWAAAFVFPGEVILRLLFATADTAEGAEAASPGTTALMTVFIIAYVIHWAGFALAMVYVSDMLDRFEKYLAYMTAHNWSSVVQIAIVL